MPYSNSKPKASSSSKK